MRQSFRSSFLALAATVLTLGAVGAGGTPARATGTIWGASYFPNVPLVNQEGQTLRFFDDLIKDKVVAINFIFTSCQDVCPLETARLREVQEILGDRVGKDIFFLSISIDPKRDTPSVLKTYSQQYHAGPGWMFLTGNMDDITVLRTKLGLLGAESDPANLKGHSMSLIIGNQATGQWMKRSPYENAHILATQMGSWLTNWKEPSQPGLEYANAPKVRNLTNGENLFRTRCNACHALGEAGPDANTKRAMAPDLLNVTARRDKVWLARWLAQPDKMLAEKDPQALAIQARYGKLVMPNLGLTPEESQALVTFLEEESHRLEEERHPATAVAMASCH
jgi:protein SCO1/2